VSNTLPDCDSARLAADRGTGIGRSLQSDLEALERRRREFVAALLDVLADLRAVDLAIAAATIQRRSGA
jgi:hypothetical protein